MRDVELFGLPGAGKTTASRVALEMLADAGVDAADGYRLAKEQGGPLRLLLASPGSRASLARSLTGGLGVLTRRDSPRESVVLCARQHAALRRRRRGQVLLFQEGWVQSAWRHLYSHGSAPADLADRIVRALPQPVPVVVFDAPPDVARQRLAGRRAIGPPLRPLAEAPLGSPRWDAAVGAFEHLVAALYRRGEAVRVRTDQRTVASLAEQLLGVMECSP